MNCWQCRAQLPPGAGFCGACGQPQQAAPPPPQASLAPFPLIMQRGLTRLTGQMFVAPTRLYFICESQKGGLGVALGQGLGGLVGGMIAAFAAPSPGQAAPVIDEGMLQEAAQQQPGSMIMEPAKFKSIKYTMWTRGIFYDKKTYALREGLSKPLQSALAQWTKANNVTQKGLK